MIYERNKQIVDINIRNIVVNELIDVIEQRYPNTTIDTKQFETFTSLKVYFRNSTKLLRTMFYKESMEYHFLIRDSILPRRITINKRIHYGDPDFPQQILADIDWHTLHNHPLQF